MGAYAVTIYAVDDGDPAAVGVLTYTMNVAEAPAAEIAADTLQVIGGEPAQMAVTVDPPSCYDLSASDLPTGAIFDPTTLTFEWPTVSDDFGIYDLTITATDPSNPLRTFDQVSRIVVEYFDDFSTYADYVEHEVHLDFCCQGPTSYEATADGDADVLHSSSALGVDVQGRAFRSFDRSAVPVAGVDFDFVSRDVVVGPACGSGGLLELFDFAITDPGATWPDWGTPSPRVSGLPVVDGTELGSNSGRVLFAMPASPGFSFALLHVDASNICTVDAYWDSLLLTPLP